MIKICAYCNNYIVNNKGITNTNSSIAIYFCNSACEAKYNRILKDELNLESRLSGNHI